MENNEVMRLFVAVTLPPEVKQALTAVSQTLVAQWPERSVRWVAASQMHLTLCFLGDTAVARVPDLTKMLDGLGTQPVFGLRLGEVGCFPNARKPRVLWVGVQGDVAALQQLAGNVRQGVAELGLPVEQRPFQAHLTIGRVQDGRTPASWGCDVPEVAFPVTAVHLIRSQLRPQGAIYTTISYKLLAVSC